MIRSAAVVLAVLSALVAGAASAAAAEPAGGQWHGEAIGFHLAHTEHGSTYVSSAHWHTHRGFERADVHRETFQTCARVRINAVLFRDYCIHAHFAGHDRASGTTKVYQGAHGIRADHPSETHHWEASFVG